MMAAILTAEHVAETLRAEAAIDRARRGPVAFPADMRGACWCASILYLVALEHHGIEGLLAYGFGHAWVEVDGCIVDLTATQFRAREHALVRSATARGRYHRRVRLSLEGALMLIRDERHQPWHPCQHFDLMTRALAKVLTIDEDAALLRVLDLGGPPYAGPDRQGPEPECFKRLGAA
jgi:hypothetical protein